MLFFVTFFKLLLEEDTLLGVVVGIKSVRYAHIIYISAFSPLAVSS